MEDGVFELPPLLDMRLKHHDLANTLHATLLEDIRSKNYDPFADRHNPTTDRAFQNSIKLIETDTKTRQKLTGPSVQREKYTSSYWRNWNREKNLLEDISYDEVKDQSAASVKRVGSSFQLSPIKEANKSSHSLALNSTKRKVVLLSKSGRNAKGMAFAAPNAVMVREKEFAAKYLGTTSVEYIVKSSLKKEIPVYSREANATVDPEDVGVGHAVGAAVGLAPRFAEPSSANLTSKCDYPPLESAVDLNKGISFPSEPRFKYPTVAAEPVASDADSLSTLPEKQAHKPGILFDKAERFGDRDTKPSVILRIPVKVDSSAAGSVVSKMTADDDQNTYNSNLTIPAFEEDKGAKLFQESHSLQENGRPSQERIDAQDAHSVSDSAAEAHSQASKLNSSFSQQQEYVEYEYFPGDKPGPGHYDIERMFDEKKNKSTVDFDALVDKCSKIKPGLAGLKCAELSRIAVFGENCNRQEHVIYGMCLDGRCCRRNESEKFMLRRNDLCRLAGYQTVETKGRNKDGRRFQGEMMYSSLMRDLLPEAEYAVEPLYAAAYNGDVNAIHALAKLKVNPNIKHPSSGYTALHAAVFKCKLDAVVALLTCFRGALRLDVQDKKGDTALHVASRMGFVEITAAICDEDLCDPLGCTNDEGKYPIDVIRTHKVWQMIKVCQTRNELQAELKALQKGK